MNINTITYDELKEGYRIITGLDNVEEFTEEELREYMRNACKDD